MDECAAVLFQCICLILPHFSIIRSFIFEAYQSAILPDFHTPAQYDLSVVDMSLLTFFKMS